MSRFKEAPVSSDEDVSIPDGFTSQWMEVTPEQCRFNPKTLRQQYSNFKGHLNQLSHMLVAHRKREGFGSAFGQAWIVLLPMLQASLYYFLVRIIFNEPGSDRFVQIYVATTFWTLHERIMGSGPTLFSGQGSLLTQTTFPFQLLVYEKIGSELYFFGYRFAILFAFMLINGYYPNVLWVLLPIFLLAQLLLTTCIMIFLSVIGTFIKDIAQALFVVNSIWWYLTPAIYSKERLPAQYQFLFQLNPFAYILPAYQQVMVLNEKPDLLPFLVIILIFSVLLVITVKLLNYARYRFYHFL